ncbi:MAG: hypothetical protein M3371_07600 [Acidobacteriota bacterium]|nr:hypothetical protein [Acidobacteriota bacterium]
MTPQQFIEEIKQLSVKDRIALIEAISRSVREELEPSDSASALGTSRSKSDELNTHERKVSATQRLHGIIKPDGVPPTDEELKEDYTNYLMEKYS